MNIATVVQMGWSGIKNGRLLELAEVEFDVLITTDRSIEHQQHLPKYDIGVVLLRAVSNRVEDLRPLVPETMRRLPLCRPGSLTTLDSPG